MGTSQHHSGAFTEYSKLKMKRPFIGIAWKVSFHAKPINGLCSSKSHMVCASLEDSKSETVKILISLHQREGGLENKHYARMGW